MKQKRPDHCKNCGHWHKAGHKKERLFLDAWKNGDLFVCCYDNDIDEKWRGAQKHKNPADAVAELLIWVKEQNYERIKNTLIDRANKLKW